MVQECAGVPHVTSVFWTLTLELIFYASCSVRHILGLFRGTWLLVWLGKAGLVVLCICCPWLSGRRFPGGYAMLFLTLCVGTLFTQWTSGRISRRRLLWFLGCLAPVSLAVSYVSFALFTRRGYPLTFHCVWLVWLSAYAGFAIALSLRDRFLPSWLCYLGRISYSIYLVHTVIVLMLPHHWPRLLYLCPLLGGTLALASLTYYWIERPGISLGRRLLTKPRVTHWGEVPSPVRRRPA